MYHLLSDVSHHPFVKVRTTGGLRGAYKDGSLSKQSSQTENSSTESESLQHLHVEDVFNPCRVPPLRSTFRNGEGFHPRRHERRSAEETGT